ncbi:MAG: hypothetical protein ACKO3R_02360, partial [bacterium]
TQKNFPEWYYCELENDYAGVKQRWILVLSEHAKKKEARLGLGKFIVATNELDASKLNPEEILNYYKDQGKVERGFRFLHDPLCMADAVFLKNDRLLKQIVNLKPAAKTLVVILQLHLKRFYDLAPLGCGM